MERQIQGRLKEYDRKKIQSLLRNIEDRQNRRVSLAQGIYILKMVRDSLALKIANKYREGIRVLCL